MDIESLENELIKAKEECSKQFTKINIVERYTEEWDKERLIFQELTRKKEMILSKLLTLEHKNVEKKGKDKVVFVIDDDFSKYKKTEVKKMTEKNKKEITHAPTTNEKKKLTADMKKKSTTNNFSQHRIEMFEKHKEDVKKMFKAKKRVSNINAFLKEKGALQDLANYILLKLKLKKMGNVPEQSWIKREEALIMAVNEKDKTKEKVKK